MAPHIKHARSNDTLEQQQQQQQQSSNETSSTSAPSPTVRRRLLSNRPLKSYIPRNLRHIVLPYHGDFCLSPHYYPPMIAQLMAEGFLPIATEGFLLPKLHRQRCVVRLPGALHVSKNVRKKKAKNYRLTINQCLDRVVTECRNQHGPSCWLYPPLVAAFEFIQQQGVVQVPVDAVRDDATSAATTTTCPVRLYSIEVWDTTSKELVAGELGYTVGSIFTSLTGFSNQNSAGSVQLAALGRLLCRQGFTLWDLGMDMEYKRSLGSELMPRDEFVQFVERVRVRDADCVLPRLTNNSTCNCRELIEGTDAIPNNATA